MTVSLQQAWDICAVLDELEIDRARNLFVCSECSYVTSDPGRAALHPPRCRHSFPQPGDDL